MERRPLLTTVLVGVLLAVAVWVNGPGATSAAPPWHPLVAGPAQPADDLARDVFDRVNAERARRGLWELSWHDGLAERAERWSQRMIAEGFEHSTAEFRRHPDVAGTGENIAMGQIDTEELHVGWMRSDGHRVNVLDPGAMWLGVGIVCRPDGTMWSTQIFGFPPADAPPPVLPPPDWPELPPVEPIVGTDRGGRCALDPAAR